MVRVRCVPGLHVPPAVGTLDVAGGEAQQVGEVGVEGPGVDGGVLRGRHAGGRAQWRQVERRADGWLQSGLGILNWDLISHWSVSGVASLAIFCNKARASNYGSFWHEGAYNRTFPYIQANNPYAIKNQPGARSWQHHENISTPWNESRASLDLDQ